MTERCPSEEAFRQAPLGLFRSSGELRLFQCVVLVTRYALIGRDTFSLGNWTTKLSSINSATTSVTSILAGRET
jgi:hypothetical protein